MINFFIIVTIVASAGFLIAAIGYASAIVFGRMSYNEPVKRVLRAGKINHYILALIIMFLIAALSGKAQPFVFGGAGMTNKYFSAELQAGYNVRNATISIGYIALPDNGQPALFNIRTGYVLANKLHVYGGYVRVLQSSDDKSRNSNTWQAGAQYLFCKYDRGSFYVAANYTGNKMISCHVGMTYNLVKEL